MKDSTGCVCYNDLAAQEIVTICARQEIKIPEQLSIVSIDNSDIARNCAVPLTSLSHPKMELGKMTAKHLIQMIQNKSMVESYEFTPELTMRESVIKRQK